VKLAYTLNMPGVDCARPLAYSGNLREATAKLATLGYDGVELMVVDLTAFSEDQAENTIRQSGLEMPCICTGEIPGQTGLSFMADDRETRVAAIQLAKRVIAFAARWKSLVNLGRFRGRIGTEHDRETYLDYFREAVWETSEYAAQFDVCWVLEPVTSLIHNFITTSAEGITWVKDINHPSFQLMLDIFHQNIDDPSIYSALIDARGMLKHIHISDNNKQMPGTGHLDLNEYLRVLEAIGYDGYLSAELFQLPDQDTAVSRTVDYMRGIIQSRG